MLGTTADVRIPLALTVALALIALCHALSERGNWSDAIEVLLAVAAALAILTIPRGCFL